MTGFLLLHCKKNIFYDILDGLNRELWFKCLNSRHQKSPTRFDDFKMSIDLDTPAPSMREPTLWLTLTFVSSKYTNSFRIFCFFLYPLFPCTCLLGSALCYYVIMQKPFNHSHTIIELDNYTRSDIASILIVLTLQHEMNKDSNIDQKAARGDFTW